LNGDISFRYIEADIRDYHAISSLEKSFDFVRMQHVLEHFSPEEVSGVVKNAAYMLKDGGFFLVTVPDLAVHVRAYLSGYKFGGWYRTLAQDRLRRHASSADTFSMFAHLYGYHTPQVFGEEHKWCYDAHSLSHLLKNSGLFCNVRRLRLLNQLSEVPFTHNRPMEDLCFIARRNSVPISFCD
jgi:predicted SAM-dependent methyltransferase